MNNSELKLQQMIVDSMLNATIVGGDTMKGSLEKLAALKGVDYLQLPEYIQLYNAWGLIAKDITNYIESYTIVKLAADIDELKTIFNSWVPVPQDGGGALKTALSDWSSVPSDQEVSIIVS